MIEVGWGMREEQRGRERERGALSLYRTLAYRQHAIRAWLVQSSLEHPHCAPRLYIDVSTLLAIVVEQCFRLAVGCFDLPLARLSGDRAGSAKGKHHLKRRLKLTVESHLFGM